MSIILSSEKLEFKSMIAYPDLSVERGSVTFISGPSGCGKSTLLRLLNATYTPSRGSIYFNGMDMEDFEAVSLRRKIILAGQNAYLFKGSIEENFRIFHEYNESLMTAGAAMKEYLKRCCLDFDLNASCDVMSGGEKQRVFLAIALSLHPEVLLLDEPTSALDINSADQVMRNIIDWCRQNDTTLILVSHDKGLQDRYAEAVIRLEGSR